MIMLTQPFKPGGPDALTPANHSIGPTATRLRFTRDGDDGLETRLARTCQSVMAGLRGLIPAHRLEAVLLGGGYGRGEGGVLRSNGGDAPYNDLEFYVCLRGNRHLNERRHHLAVAVLGEILSQTAGVEVEFKIISLAELRRSPVSMFSYDLIMGHRWLTGHGGLLSGFTRHRLAGQIPPAEATRLLMNRCTGLLFAQERLDRPEFTAADADFVQRNQAKAALAFGDAVLTAHHEYHWSCAERHRRLQRLNPAGKLSWLDEVRHHHAAGLRFKLHPVQSTAARAVLQAQQDTVVALGLKVWLWHESGRLATRFASAGDYIRSRRDQCPETRRMRNLLVNFKAHGLSAFFQSNPFRHPRERVLRDLCRLLWARPAPAPPEAARPPAAGAGFSRQVSAYKQRWERVH